TEQGGCRTRSGADRPSQPFGATLLVDGPGLGAGLHDKAVWGYRDKRGGRRGQIGGQHLRASLGEGDPVSPFAILDIEDGRLAKPVRTDELGTQSRLDPRWLEASERRRGGGFPFRIDLHQSAVRPGLAVLP